MTSATESVAAYLAARREEVDRALDRLLPAETAWPLNLHRAIRHSVFAGGKRLRPILCLAAAEVLGAPAEDVLEPACGLEMIHTYSLIHDDRPPSTTTTCAAACRPATSSSASDGDSRRRLPADQWPGVFALYPKAEAYAGAKVRVLQTVVEAIGTQGMIGGQAADLEAEKETDPTAELVAKIHENKTGRLIRASLLAGAIVAGANEDALAHVDHYGRRIGLAFQIKDDLLDVESDAATLGKAAGKDSAHGKATFPGVWGVERSRELLAENVPGGGGVLPELARFVGSRKS
jgi:geranylgeranyl diphosphate synthase type II